MRLATHTHIIILFLSLLIIASCGKGENSSADKTNVTLRQIDEELGVRSPEARKIIDEGIATSKDSMTRYEYEARLARFYYLSPTPDSLLPVIKRVEKFAETKTNEERGRLLLAYAYNTHAVYYHAFHLEQNKQKELYDKAYKLIMASEDKSEAHKVAANLGDAYAFANELPEAAGWYRRALFLVDSLHLSEKENATLYLGLAGIYQQLGDNDNALKYFKQTEKGYKSMPIGMQAYFLNNFGNYYYYIHDYKSALKKFLALQHFLEENNMQDNFDMYLCKINLADVYLNLGELDKSKECLDAVEPFANKHGDPAMLYYCRTIRIGIAVKEKDWSQVSRLSSTDPYKDKVAFQLRQIRARYMKDYYLSVGDYKQAYTDLASYELYNDSLEHNRTNMRTTDIMSRFTADTLRLHHDVEMQKQQTVSQRNQLVAVIAISIVIILAVVFMLFVQRSHKRMAEGKMKALDLRLQSARVRISPHFIFNVLNNHMLTNGNREEDAEIIQLSKLIRANLSMSRELVVTLSEELHFVRQYVTVEQPLVGDDFDFKINIGEGIDVEKVKVPSMIIQIMVENAFKHALSGWTGHKILHIDVVHNANLLKISVIDNGKGFNMAATIGKDHQGLNIIRQTIAVLNSKSKRKMLFKMENVTENGKIMGCCSSITIPDNFRFMKQD